MKLTHRADRHWESVMKSLALVVAVAGVALLISGGGPAQADPPSLATHDANMTSQHNTQSGQVTTHDSAQTTQHNTLSQQHQSQTGAASAHDSAQTSQHNALSQQIGNLSTTADHRGLPQAWDKTLPANDPGGVCPANSSRFTCVMGGAAVRDNETGLVWEQSPSTSTFTWQNAQLHCNVSGVGNRRGWRLPTLQELASLVDPTQSNPALPAGHPFSGVQSSGGYWSATTYAADASIAWDVGFGFGDVNVGVGKSLTFFVWCVRGGHGVDPQ